MQGDPAGVAALACRRRRVPVGVRQRRPVVAAGGARTFTNRWSQSASAYQEVQNVSDPPHGDLPGQPLVGDVGDLRVHVLELGVRSERRPGLAASRSGPALEPMYRSGGRMPLVANEPHDRRTRSRRRSDRRGSRQAGERVVDAHRVERGAVDVTVVGHGRCTHRGSTAARRWLGAHRQMSPTTGGSAAGPCQPGRGYTISPLGRRPRAVRRTAGRRSRRRASPCRTVQVRPELQQLVEGQPSALPPPRPAVRVTRSSPVSQMTAS